MRRYELTDERWKLIEPLLPRPGGKGGRRWRDHRQVLNGILWVLHTGAQWRELPERYGPWKTVYGRFRRWRDEGLFDRVLHALQLRLDEQGRVDPDLWLVDGTGVRASRSAAGGKGGGAAARPLSRALPWRVRDEDPPAGLWPRRPPRGEPYARPEPREPGGRRPAGPGANPTAQEARRRVVGQSELSAVLYGPRLFASVPMTACSSSSSSRTTSASSQMWSATPASIAGVTRSDEWTRQKL